MLFHIFIGIHLEEAFISHHISYLFMENWLDFFFLTNLHKSIHVTHVDPIPLNLFKECPM